MKPAGAWAGGMFLERLEKRSDPPHAVLNEIGVFRKPIIILVGESVAVRERVLPKVKHFRCTQAGYRVCPYRESSWQALLAEHDLPVFVAIGDQFAVVVEVVEFAARGFRSLARQVRQLI